MIYLWIIYCLILTLGILGVSLTSASRLSDFFVIILLIPLLPTLLSDFAKYRKKHRLRTKTKIQFANSVGINPHIIPDTSAPSEEGVVLDPTISDNNRRLFLRLAGSSGLALFMLVVFGQKSAQAAFFGSVPGPGTVSVKNSAGDTIDPAEKLPTDGYTITEIDDSSIDAYYGFVDKTGAWYITKEFATGAYRYAKGTTGFTINWGNRTSLTYDYFDNVF